MNYLMSFVKLNVTIVSVLLTLFINNAKAQTIEDITRNGLDIELTCVPIVFTSHDGYNKLDSEGRKHGVWVSITKGTEKWITITNYRNGKANGLEYQLRQIGNNQDISKNKYSLDQIIIYQNGIPKITISYEINGNVYAVGIIQRNKDFKFITDYADLPNPEDCFQEYTYLFKDGISMSSRGWNIIVDESIDCPNDVVGKWVDYNSDGTIETKDYGGYIDK